MSYARVYQPRDVFGIDIKTRHALLHRESDYNIDDDGHALSNEVWCWRGGVNLHRDDMLSSELVMGMVLETGPKMKLVHGDRAFDLRVGSVYVIDPYTDHGVISWSGDDPLICYLTTIKFADRPGDVEVPLAAFRRKALNAAMLLVNQPPPVFEDA